MNMSANKIYKLSAQAAVRKLFMHNVGPKRIFLARHKDTFQVNKLKSHGRVTELCEEG